MIYSIIAKPTAYQFVLGWLADSWSGAALTEPQDVVNRAVAGAPSLFRVEG